MVISLTLYKEIKRLYQPKKHEIKKWVQCAILKAFAQVNIDVMIVNSKRSQEINLQYRNKNKPTNVISLEYADTRENFNFLFGELILCDDVIITEAVNQNKDIKSHYAHMVIHGVLHLQGYDHVQIKDREQMEALEIKIMNQFGYNNPYITR